MRPCGELLLAQAGTCSPQLCGNYNWRFGANCFDNYSILSVSGVYKTTVTHMTTACVCFGVGIGLTFYLNFLGLYTYVLSIYIFHYQLAQLTVPHFSPSPMFSLSFWQCLVTVCGLVHWCMSEQVLHLPYQDTLLRYWHFGTDSLIPLPSESFATVAKNIS